MTLRRVARHGAAALALVTGFAVPVCAQQNTLNAGLEKSGQRLLGNRFDQVPLYFESVATSGSSDRFVAHGLGYRLGLSPTKAHFALHNTPLTLALKGANPNATLTPQQTLPTRVNYLLGNNPNAWKTNLPTFGKVRAQGVYPGIDLVYYGNGKQLEYDFIVAPKSDPSRIRLKFAEAKQVAVEKDGSLRLGLGKGSVRWKAPVAYQEQSGKRMAVASRYVVDGAGAVSFSLGRYDHSKPLIIDPTFVYSTYLTGLSGTVSSSTTVTGISVAPDGGTFVAGTTTGSSFPGATGLVAKGGNDVYVLKFSADGTTLQFATLIGGSASDVLNGLAVDASSNIYLTGTTFSTNFPVSTGTTLVGAQSDAFVVKLKSDGTIAYGTYLGGSGEDGGLAVAADSAGNTYVTGYTSSPNFPRVGAAYNAPRGGRDAFLTKLSLTGTRLYSTYLGGGGTDEGRAIAVSANDIVTLAGTTTASGTAFPTVGSGYLAPNRGGQDAFVARFDTSKTGTSSVVFTSLLGGSGADFANGLAFDGSGNILVTGSTASSNFPTSAGALSTTLSGASDAFVTELSSSASFLLLSTYLGGSGADTGTAITVDSLGSILVTGNTQSTNFPVTPTALQATSGGGAGGDAFVAKFNLGATGLAFATYLGGSATDSGLTIAVGARNEVLVGGVSTSTNYPITAAAYQTSGNASSAGFVTRLRSNVAFDLNGDGYSDLVFQNKTSGEVLTWLLKGYNTIDRQFIRTSLAGTDYVVVGTGDFDGDGYVDILAQQKGTGQFLLIYMNGITQKDRTYFGLPIDPAWEAVTVADINGDGYPDITFRNKNTGALYVWTLQNLTVTGKYTLYNERPGTPLFLPLDYQVVGAGDFNGDGTPDLLFQHQTAGIVLCWYLRWNSVTNAPEVLQRNYAIGRRDPKWKVVGAAQLTGSGTPNIVLQNTDTGAVAAYVMNGLSLTNTVYLRSSFPTDWVLNGLK